MDKYILFLTIVGLAAFAMAWMPGITKHTGISYSIIYVLAGVLLYTLLPGIMPNPLPSLHENLTMRLTEMVVLISLMGTGIRIDRSFTLKNWATPLKLISITMLLCIGGAALAGYYFLGLDVASAALLGAVLAPTDPVLASDVQVGPPNEGFKSETRFSLTAEAGLNDGMAFPFTWLAITLALIANGAATSLVQWFTYDFLYKIIAGLVMGYLLGKAVGNLVFRISTKYKFLKTNDGFLALALTLLVYGLTELVHGYGFIAVFISAITFRHSEKKHDLHDELHSFTDQAERVLVAVVLILFGGTLVSGILSALTWKMVLFTLFFVFFIRPVAAYASVFTTKIHLKEKLAISFFGIRGLGTIFYLAFAFRQVEFRYKDELWAIAAFTILISIVIHGLSATPIMRHLKENMPIEKTPE
jgi:sodium/hydrogen antiporter